MWGYHGVARDIDGICSHLAFHSASPSLHSASFTLHLREGSHLFIFPCHRIFLYHTPPTRIIFGHKRALIARMSGPMKAMPALLNTARAKRLTTSNTLERQDKIRKHFDSLLAPINQATMRVFQPNEDVGMTDDGRKPVNAMDTESFATMAAMDGQWE